MRIGFDIDGVLADFVPAYQDLFIAQTGRDTFGAGDRRDPPEWNWPTLRGYTKEETSAVWGAIKQSNTFWMNLAEDHGCPTLRTMLPELEHKHEVYFVTSRLGRRPKRQTEIWLIEHLRYLVGPLSGVSPTVLIAAYRQKGLLAKGLDLDAYIDDNADNANDVAWGTVPGVVDYALKREGQELDLTAAPTCRVYLLNRAYNASYTPDQLHASIVRVDSIGQMFDKEIALGNL
jgi:hypothetical protein